MENNTSSGAIYIDGKPFNGLRPLEATPRIDSDAIMKQLREQCTAATELHSDLLTMTPKDQDALYAAARRLGAATGEAVEAIAEVFQQFVKKVTAAANAIARPLSDFLSDYFKHQEELWSVATPRQWHLYIYGKPRVSKKWEHVFKKRLAQQKKKGGHRGEISKI